MMTKNCVKKTGEDEWGGILEGGYDQETWWASAVAAGTTVPPILPDFKHLAGDEYFHAKGRL